MARALALTRAEKTFDRAADAATPTWLGYFDEAYFAAKLAHCFRDLNNPQKAEEYATRSLRMDPTYQRGKAFNTAVLSMTLAAQGRIDEACARGESAIDLAAGLTSARVYRYIRNLGRSVQPHADEPLVRDFTEYAEQRLPALRPHAERP